MPHTDVLCSDEVKKCESYSRRESPVFIGADYFSRRIDPGCIDDPRGWQLFAGGGAHCAQHAQHTCECFRVGECLPMGQGVFENERLKTVYEELQRDIQRGVWLFL